MSIRTLGLTIVSLALAAAPFIASAQSFNNASFCGYSYPYAYNNNGAYNNQSGTCGPQTLLVYVSVINPTTGYTYTTGYTNTSYVPSNFSVSVSGSNPSPATFPGSLSGTPVQLGFGSYSVSVSGAPANFTASYSAGCTGTIGATGQGPLCVITESSTGGYSSYPTPYPYPYTTPAPLACAPSYQTINIGQSATFTVLGGAPSYVSQGLLTNSTGYNWQTLSRSYLDIGPSLTTLFQSTGVQSVTVSNGTQSATCTVDVVGAAAPIVYSNTVPTSVIPAYVTSTYIPGLPNTGFAPHTAAELALALALLGLAAIAAYPYVRNISLALLD